MALRLLHTSDVHIGHATGVGDHLHTCICPVLGVIEAAGRVEADALLIAGDLFDHGRLPGPVVDGVLSVLGDADLPVVVMPGNHDVFDESSLWLRADLGNVTLLDDHAGTMVTLLDGGLHVWGKAMPEHDRHYRPLADVPDRPGSGGAYVVMGHGFHETDDSMRSSPITPADIAATSADYVALGHIHVRLDVSSGGVPAWYCGAPVGITSSGTCNVVTIDDGVHVDAVEVQLPAEGCAELAVGSEVAPASSG